MSLTACLVRPIAAIVNNHRKPLFPDPEYCFFAKQKSRSMEMPMLTWSCLVALIAVFIFVRVFRYLISSHPASRKNMFTFGSEREEFFIPGDRIRASKSDNYDAEDL